MCRSGYQLRQLRPLDRSMSFDAVNTLVQAFISCRLDYCNSMFCIGFRFSVGWLQDGHSDLRVTVGYGSTLPGRRLSAGLWRRSSSAAFYQLKDMCRQTDLQQLWICFAAADPRLWNSLPAHLRQTDINFEQFKRQLRIFTHFYARKQLLVSARLSHRNSVCPSVRLSVRHIGGSVKNGVS